MDLFVCGRLCLLGEHSDWAGGYRQSNTQILPGSAIVVGTNQGLSAQVTAHTNLVFQTTHHPQALELAMDETLLHTMAQSHNFYSYVAGVAYQALRHYQVGGLAINNYAMDLPLQKGLSSSAAICVLVARAFNQIYGLGLSLREEMNLAYWGERTTPSQCGQLDQACAYGKQPILMTFDGDRVEVEPLVIGQDLYLIIVDLGGSKDTQRILTQLNQCYPLAHTPLASGVQNYLGAINQELVQQGAIALRNGNAKQLGQLMTQAQHQFDHYLAPVCPEELTAPLLHQLLGYEPLQPHIWGGKGVGSQGDGTVQLVARDRAAQQQAIALIELKFPHMTCYPLDIPQTN